MKVYVISLLMTICCKKRWYVC